jgi:uncharacterized Tic20 family protein
MTEPAPAAPTPAAPLSEADDKQWASFAHFGGILGILPALIIWLVFKDRGVKTNVEGKEALNFQITILIVYIIGVILSFVFIGAIINLAAWIVAVIFSIQGGIKVNAGGSYKYPFALRLIK